MESEDSQSLIRLAFTLHIHHLSNGFPSLSWRHHLLGSEKNSVFLCFQCYFLLTKKVLQLVPDDLDQRSDQAELKYPKLFQGI